MAPAPTIQKRATHSKRTQVIRCNWKWGKITFGAYVALVCDRTAGRSALHNRRSLHDNAALAALGARGNLFGFYLFGDNKKTTALRKSAVDCHKAARARGECGTNEKYMHFVPGHMEMNRRKVKFIEMHYSCRWLHCDCFGVEVSAVDAATGFGDGVGISMPICAINKFMAWMPLCGKSNKRRICFSRATSGSGTQFVLT